MIRLKAILAISVLMLPLAVSAGWEIGLESVAPTGDFGDVAGGGGGVYAQHLHPMNDNVLLSGYVGAIAYGGVKLAGVEIQWYGYPITVGGTYYTKDVDAGGFFVKGNAGLVIKRGTLEFQGVELDESETGFVVSPGVGWDFGRFNVAADYNLGNDDWTWFAVKAAYRFRR